MKNHRKKERSNNKATPLLVLIKRYEFLGNHFIGNENLINLYLPFIKR